MKKLLFSITIFILAAVCVTSCKKDDPVLVEYFEVIFKEEFNNTLYPSLLYSLPSLQEQYDFTLGLFTVAIVPKEPIDIRLVAEASALSDETTVITYEDATGTLVSYHSLDWKYDELKNLTQGGTVDITFVLYINEKEAARKTLNLKYSSVNECFLHYVDKENNRIVNFSSILASYVNEDSPAIESFMDEVLATSTLITEFTEYTNGYEEVINQANAIFTRLREKGISFGGYNASILTTNESCVTRYIRFADEVLTDDQANCVDGAIFFSSVLQKIGIDPYIFFDPDHVYIGFYIDQGRTTFRSLDIASIGNNDISFEDAMAINEERRTENMSLYTNEDYSDGYYIISVNETRKILSPIGR